jgi:hypothetical protein
MLSIRVPLDDGAYLFKTPTCTTCALQTASTTLLSVGNRHIWSAFCGLAVANLRGSHQVPPGATPSRRSSLTSRARLNQAATVLLHHCSEILLRCGKLKPHAPQLARAHMDVHPRQLPAGLSSPAGCGCSCRAAHLALCSVSCQCHLQVGRYLQQRWAPCGILQGCREPGHIRLEAATG